jgi:hypothetical protein
MYSLLAHTKKSTDDSDSNTAIEKQ